MKLFKIKIYFVVFQVFLLASTAMGQNDSTLITNQDAIYNRPFISIGQTKTAVGGYVEGNTNYFSEDGVSEGFSMELRRFNIFMYSQIHPRIKFLSELEFEHGTEEIAIETALLDFQINSALNFRAGILLPALGLFNTNHDSPNWEFIERPLSSTGIIPSTLSEVGFGFHGKFFPSENSIIAYDAYVVNGLQDNIILNAEGKTFIPSGKSPEMFGEDNNGTPMLNGRLSYSNRKLGEIGFAWYGGTYNTFKVDGIDVEEKRSLSIAAIDFQTKIKSVTIKGELVYAAVDVPSDIQEIYGTRQYAGFVDLIYPILKRRILKYDGAILSLALRAEAVDYNWDDFSTNTSRNIGDENRGFSLGLTLRPQSGTVIRANYLFHWVYDNLGNPAAKVAGFQFGVASYF